MEKEQNTKIVNNRPLVFITIALIVGILCSYFCYVYSKIILLAVVVLIAVVLIATFNKIRDRKNKFLALLIILSFLVGFCAFEIKVCDYQKAKDYYFQVKISGKVSQINKNGDFNFCEISSVKVDNNKVDFKISGLLDSDVKLKIGDNISFDANLNKNKINNFVSLEGIFADKVYYTFYINSDIVKGNNSANIFEKCNLAVKDYLSTGLNGNSYNIAVALLLGDTSNLETKQIQIYRMSGIAHVFAVSGLHIGIFYGIISFIADRLKLKKHKLLLFIFLPLIIYCGICGFGKSVLRAFIMCLIAKISKIIGFKYDRLNSLSIACLILLLLNCGDVFGVGFLLSFTACFSIISIMPIFMRGAGVSKNVVGDSISLSLSAQVGTLPILTNMCGYISIISLFANLIFVPIVVLAYQFLLIFASAGAVEFLIFGNAKTMMFLPSVVINFVDKLIGVIDYKAFLINDVTFDKAILVYYVGLLFCSDLINTTKIQKIIIALITISLTIFLCLL